MVESRKVLVTGGAGFIGSHLVDRLLNEGYQVSIIDELTTGKLSNLSPAATFYHSDISEAAVDEIFGREQPDIVFHLAARVSVTYSTRNPVDTAEVNVVGTLRLLEAARRMGLEKFIFSSTGGAIYGIPDDNPCSEETPVVPVSPYGLSKYLAEKYIELFHRLYRVNFTNLRYGNVYGPRQDPDGEAGVISIFTQAMLEGRQPRIFGDGTQERDFVYVDDVVEANIKAIERGNNRTFNIGTGQGTSVNDLFEILRELTGFPLEAEHRPRRPGEVQRIFLECSQARTHLDWSPAVGLAEGLRKTVEYYKCEASPSRRSA
ncbi:MAG: NAD-dependent epimerase/dehydratase family protein [Chloroflexi bacterium]|nr:NAD-dependent epimerase/dehydratase family protein [Chloroflexota bacterium]